MNTSKLPRNPTKLWTLAEVEAIYRNEKYFSYVAFRVCIDNRTDREWVVLDEAKRPVKLIPPPGS